MNMASSRIFLIPPLRLIRKFTFNYSTLSSEKPKRILKLTESCIKRLNQVSDGQYLRISVEGGGCSGFQYKFCLDNTVNEDDEIFVENGAKVIIDSTSLDYLDGSVVDYHTELIRASFQVINIPKADGGCSCGASFSLKVD